MADEYEDEYEETYEPGGAAADPSGMGVLAAMMGAYNTTTPEAQNYSRRILDKQLDEDPFSTEAGLMEDLEAQAELARQALRNARAKLAEKKYSTARLWLAASAGLGQGTRSGSFGESMSNLSEQLLPEIEARDKFEEARDAGLLDYDKSLIDIDQGLIGTRMKLAEMKRKQEAQLAKEALKILGRPTQIKALPKTGQDKAAEALDKAYVKDYIAFTQGGAADPAKTLEELAAARRMLQGVRLDPGTGEEVPLKNRPNISGWIGIVPKFARDLFFPKSSETQEDVESTVQRSLKAILGSQFTAKEGERLIERVYNPRFDEPILAKRVGRLITQIERAYAEKIRAARYFEEHGTLRGYQGKTSWSFSDFEPEDDEGGTDPLSSLSEEYEEAKGTVLGNEPARSPAGDDYVWEDFEPAKARGGRVGYAEGGSVKLPDGRIRHTMPDGSTFNTPAQITYKQALQRWQEKVQPTQTTPRRAPVVEEEETSMFEEDAPVMESLETAGMAGLGAAGAATADRIGPAVLDRVIPGRRETQGQRRILDVLQERGITPDEIVSQVQSTRKMGIPAMAMDVGDPLLRKLAESSMAESGGPHATEALQRLQSRVAEAPERTMEHVNQALAPDEYFDQLDKLTENLYTEARPLYQKAYDQHPAVKSDMLMKILETPAGKKAVKTAITLMRNQPGKKIGKSDAVGMIRSPSLEFLDHVKRGFDQLISKEEKHGPTELGRSMRTLRNALREELDVATTPKKGESLYKQARAQFAGDLEVLDALKLGRENYMSMQPKEAERLLADMSFSEKDALRTGVAQKLFETIEAPTSETNSARKIIGSPANRKKLQALFDSEKEYKLFETALTKEMELYDASKKSINAGEAGQAQHVARKPEGMRKYATKVPRLGLKSPVMWTLQFIRNVTEKDEKKIDEVMKFLKAATPEELTDMDKILSPKLKRRVSRAGRAGKVAGAGAAAGAAYELMTEDEEDEE